MSYPISAPIWPNVVERSIPMPAWPNDADVAVSLTFDIDAESGWVGDGAQYEKRLTTLSEGRFGIVRGLPRILELLDKFNIKSTFYIPGDSAERHAEALAAVVAAGHDIGNHGNKHLRSYHSSPEAQREEIERGVEAIKSCLGIVPRGYRSPCWEITPETFMLLLEFGFAYDGSFFGDDRPYLMECQGKSILEFPGHWSIDDWPHFEWTTDRGGNLNDPESFLRVWLGEFDSALKDRRHVTYTMHPEVIGRGYRIQLLERFVETVMERGNVWFASHGEVAAHLASQVELVP